MLVTHHPVRERLRLRGSSPAIRNAGAPWPRPNDAGAGESSSGNSLEFGCVSHGTTVAVRALGPYGGSAPGYRLTTFLLDGETALDAGCLTDALPLAAQRRIKRVLLTHAHFDHIASLPLLCDNLYGQAHPLEVLAPAPVLATLRRDVF